MGFLVYLVVRLMFGFFVLAAVAAVICFWLFAWLVIYIAAFVYVGFDEHRARKIAQSKLGPIPQARFSNRR